MPNAECGQGVYTGEAPLIAEELGVGLDQIQVAAAPLGGPCTSNPLLELQATGGSTSIKGAWTPFRQAGAMARIMLVQAAAQAWGVPESECVAKRGVITHAASGRSAPYGSFAEAASRLPKPAQVALKPPSQFELIGKRLQRVDTPAKVVGEAKYGENAISSVPGMKIATIAASPVLGGAWPASTTPPLCRSPAFGRSSSSPTPWPWWAITSGRPSPVSTP